MARTIAILDISHQSRNDVVDFVLKHKTQSNDSLGFGNERRRNAERLAQEYTVQDFVEAVSTSWLNADISAYNWNNWLIWIRKGFKTVLEALAKLGLTQLDWIVMPSSTVTPAMLLKLGRGENRQELFDQSVLVLGTLSSRACSVLIDHFGQSLDGISVSNLLTVPDWVWRNNYAHVEKSIIKTRRRLLHAGLCYEDGLFLQEGTRRQVVEILMERVDLSPKSADDVANLAVELGWVKSFRE